jgi:DNA-binding transcriptional LysR family regulator
MQWDLLRSFEAVARLGSLTAASRALGVSQSTISRQLARLEEDARSPLLLRSAPIRLTERGEALLTTLAPMLDAARAAEAALEASPELHGQVTVTTVGELVRWVLVPALPEFCAAHPQLNLRILADNHITSLAAGDADVALRFARPERGELVGRRLRSEPYAYFAAVGVALHGELPWLGLTGSLAQIPEQRHAERAFAGRPPRLQVEDLESLGLAVAAGLGVALLPRRLAARLSGVRAVAPQQVGALLPAIAPRELWVVVHRARQHVPRVRAVVAWLATCMGQG